MSWIYELRKLNSEQNGQITCRKLFGRWQVNVGGFGQTCGYANRLFRSAFKKIPTEMKIKKILVLGLGSGGIMTDLHKRWPKAQLTLVDHEVTKAAIGFDLIVVDLFSGGMVSSELEKEQQIKNILKLLNKTGFLIVNAFDNLKILTNFSSQLSEVEKWKYRYNWVGLFRPFGNGRVGDPLPPDHVYFKQSPQFLVSEASSAMPVTLVGQPGCWGVRFKSGPLYIERYTSDVEPKLEDFPHFRLIFWQRITRIDRPHRWYRAILGETLSGFTEVTGAVNYWTNWSSHAKRHRHNWLKENNYEIKEVGLEDFIKNYADVKTLSVFLKDLFVRLLRNNVAVHKELFHMFGAVDRQTGEIVSGLAVLDTPDANQTHHVVAFIKDSAAHTSVGVGLIDYWFQHAIKNNIKYLNFGLFWSPGHSNSMKGFSYFKSQFDIHYVLCPDQLFRIVLGKK